MFDEACWIIPGDPERRRVIQKAEQRVWVALGSDPGLGALARLPGAIQGDHARTGESHSYEVFRLARY